MSTPKKGKTKELQISSKMRSEIAAVLRTELEVHERPNERRAALGEPDAALDGTRLSLAEIVERYPHMKERVADFEEGFETYVLLEQMPEQPDCLIQSGRENQLDVEILEPNPDGTVFLHLQPTLLCEDCETLVELATDLAAYIADRAIVEGVRSELTVGFFVEELRTGVTTFFGIQISDDDDGVPVMVHDTQEPHSGYFDTWMGRVTVH